MTTSNTNSPRDQLLLGPSRVEVLNQANLLSNLDQILYPEEDGFAMFRALDENEANEFKELARQKYKRFEPIEGIWHPIYQMECVLMNHEVSLYRIERDDPELPKTT